MSNPNAAVSGRSFSRHIVEQLESRTLLAAAPTTLDTTFGNGGSVVTDFSGGADIANDVAIQKDGKILVVGSAHFKGNFAVSPGDYAAVIRYNADGTLDDGGPNDSTPADRFGDNGKIFSFYKSAVSTDSEFTSVVVQSDGRIVLGGNITTVSFITGKSQTYWFFTRLNADGSTDGTYGVNGFSYANFFSSTLNSTISDMVLQPGNKPVVVGTFNGDWVIARLGADGYFDKSFVGDGYFFRNSGGDDSEEAVALDNSGNIIVAGKVLSDTNGYSNVDVAKYLPDGNLDTTFGQSGSARFSDTKIRFLHVKSVAVLANGDIFVGCVVYKYGAVLPFASDGTPGEYLAFQHVNDLVVTANDRPFLVGDDERLSPPSFCIADYFNLNTLGRASSLQNSSASAAAAVNPDGTIIVAGKTYIGSSSDFAVARFTGVSPTQFGTISSQVFIDKDGDGVKDRDEAGSPGARVFIDTNNDGKFNPATPTSFAERSVLADAHGNYRFSGLLPATYKLGVVPPAGYTVSLPGKPGLYTVTIAANTTIGRKHFGLRPPRVPVGSTSINVSVFNDIDADGTRDIIKPVEPNLIGWQVFLDLNKDGKRQKNEPIRTTNGSGNVLFQKLAPGTYRVTDILPSGWQPTNPASGFIDLVVAAGKSPTVLLGNVQI